MKNFNSYVIGDTIENEVNLDKNITIDLSPGEWVIVEKTNYHYNLITTSITITSIFNIFNKFNR